MRIDSPNFMAKYINSLNRFNPHGEAIIFGDQRITWKELSARVMKMAQALLGLGVLKNEKIAFLFHNSPEFIETNLAIQVAGAIPVPVNYRFTKTEVEYQINHSDAVVFIYDAILEETVRSASPALKNIRHYICKKNSSWDRALDYDAFMGKEKAADPCIETVPEDIAVIIYTGGTTGFPKGVMLTYQSQIDILSTIGRHLPEKLIKLDIESITQTIPANRWGKYLVYGLLKLKKQPWLHHFFESPRVKQRTGSILSYALKKPGFLRFFYRHNLRLIFPSMPLFHDASYVLMMTGVIMGNWVFIIPAGISFQVKDILKTIAREKPFIMANVPTGWKKIVSFDCLEAYDLSSVKIGITGSSVAPVSLKQKIFEKFQGIVLVDAFGQTEMITASLRIDTGPETLKNRSVGKSLVETKIVDESGNEVRQGEIGEICYRSSTAMKGYYKEENSQKDVMTDGWLKSGDLGFIDDDGEIRLVDRKKECINTGGEKVFPLEVEEVIHENPKVENVCVIGVPDEEWGHQVRAVVQLKKGTEATPQEIMEFCRQKLAGYKICRSVTFVERMPISPMGKIRRAEIKKLYGNA